MDFFTYLLRHYVITVCHNVLFIEGNSNPQDCNADGIDDVCEDEFESGWFEGEETGDVNHSGETNVTDIVIIIDNILSD